MNDDYGVKRRSDGGPMTTYADLLARFPRLFANPPGAAFEILLDPEDRRAAELEQAAKLREAGLPTIWSQTGVVFEDQYGRVVRDAVRYRDGSLGTYVRDFGDGGGVVVLVECKGKLLLVRHFRHATRTWLWEAPRGFSDPSKPVADEARRELMEEVGTEPLELTDLGLVHPDAGASTSAVRLMLARVDRIGKFDELEGIDDAKLATIAEVQAMIADSSITDSFTIAAFARAHFQRLLPER